MLSGIKIGKRKRPASTSSNAQPPSIASKEGYEESQGGPAAAVAGNGTRHGDSNRRAAEALRMSLVGGSDSNERGFKSESQPKIDASASSYQHDSSTINNLQSRGRISTDAVSASGADDTIVINSCIGSKSTALHEKEQKIRYNSRGKLSRHAHEQLRKNTDNATIEEMAAQERRSPTNMDEIYARNMLRLGKGYRKLDKAMGTNSRSGADEEDYLQEGKDLSNLYRSNDDRLSPAEVAARSKSRQVAQHDAISKFTSKSWWWMEAPTFDKRHLIALGEKASLVMTPTHKRLEQPAKKGTWTGGQCYIVPLPYSESCVGLDEEVWYEVQRFQTSLRQMFRREGRGALFLETVTRTSRGGGGTALQAKMEVVPVPRAVERDAPLYFKSALADVAQEWGTHSKLIVLSEKKTLRNSVPKGFPYFYCGWEGGGFIHMIEHEDDGDDEDGGMGGLRGGGGSKSFPRNFGIDTIGGIMECDPIRFQRKNRSRDGDRAEILHFCEKWKTVDWTLELDG